MTLLILGLLLFLGLHSIRIFAPEWRNEKAATLGDGKWKGLYSVAAIIGLIVLVYGYGQARHTATQLFIPPGWASHALLIAMPVALTLWFASQPGMGFIKKTVKHPLVASVILWSTFHLIANGDSASVVLFGGMLIWALVDLWSCSRRPQPEQPKPTILPDVISLAIGLAATWAFVSFFHEWLIGVAIL